MLQERRPSPRVLAFSLLGLAIFLAWQALSLRSYIRAESRPPSWDQAVHLQTALECRDVIQRGDWPRVLHLAPKPGMPPFPPLYYLLLHYACTDNDLANAALWLNWFYLVVLSVSLFAIAWHFRPDETALLGALIFAGSPMVQELLHTQLIDLSLAAWAAAAYWAILASDEFMSWGGSLAFGLIFAVGMMHKWSFFSYFFPVYYMALKALGRRSSWAKVVAAAVVAAAGFGPWYWLRGPELIPRLFAASSDFAVPVWQGGAVLNYLGQMVSGLGPLFFVFSILGICMPQYYRRWNRGWVLVAWFLSSYIFWTLVPNRQLRFLMPGLPALAVAGLGAWPESILWLVAAAQVFAAANFTAGWVLPVSLPTPFGTFQLVPSAPPAREDWKLAEILKEAEKLSDPDRPIANLTLVANDVYFNGPNFNWTARLLALPHVRMRGVNSRLCEFSQFLVLKDGRLGPKSVIGGLPEAAKIVKDEKSWFHQAFSEARQWPLPDGSTAVLYRHRRFKTAPLKGKSFEFQYYTSGAFEASNLVVELGGWDARRSVWRRATVSASEAILRGLRLKDLQVEMEDVLFMPILRGGEDDWVDVRLLRLGKLRIKSLRTDADALKAFLEAQAKGIKVSSVELDKTLKAGGVFKRFSIAVELSAELQKSPPGLLLGLREARIGDTSVPGAVLRPWRSFLQPFTPNPEMPFFIEVPGLTIANGKISVP